MRSQQSQVTGNRLSRIGSLPFNFTFGACTITRDQILMCFGDGQVRKCRLTKDLENFKEIMSSQYDHRGVRMATDDLERTFGRCPLLLYMLFRETFRTHEKLLVHMEIMITPLLIITQSCLMDILEIGITNT